MLRVLPLLLSLMLLGPVAVLAQDDGSLPLSSDRPPVRVEVEPAFQRYVDGTWTLTQWSTRVSAVVPITSRLQVRASTSAADATATIRDSTTDVRGLSDVRASLLYAQPVGEGSVILSVDANLPVGTRELTPEEVRTSVFLAQPVYGFRVPGFGQGFNVAPRVTYAVPVSDAVAVGVGASYRYLGAYQPVEGQGSDYQPGGEMEVFAGVDVQVSEAVSVSADASYARYGTDQLGGRDRFEPGDRIAGTLQALYQRDFTSVRVVARGQYRGTSSLIVPDRLLDAGFIEPSLDDRQIVPSMGAVRARFATRLTESVRGGVHVEGRHDQATTLMDARTTGTVGAEATIRLVDALAITPQAAYTLGDVRGVEAALRTALRF